MAREDWLNLDYRKSILEEIKSEENIQRKLDSFRQSEVIRDRMHKYVFQYLAEQLSEKTARTMPIISSINLAKRINEKEANIYVKEPERTFENVTDDQAETLNNIYECLKADVKLLQSNRKYKTQNQNIIQVIPKMGKLMCRVLWMHQIDVVPDSEMPEMAEAYILSAFDKSRADQGEMQQSSALNTGAFNGFYADQKNQKIADQDDYKALSERYVVWTKDWNFVMNGKGEILSQEINSPIPGHLPFIDVAGEKDFEFFVRNGQSITDFTIQYNAAVSDMYNVIRIQGYSQAVISGPANLIPDEIKVGPNSIIRLAIDPNNPVETKFEFINPTPDVKGSLDFINMLLSTFMSSRGVDPKTVVASGDVRTFASGLDRFLAMIETFEASRSDYKLYENVEIQLFELIKQWSNALFGTDQLMPEYQVRLSDDAEISVKFAGPEQVKTESETLDSIQRKMELGLLSRAEGLAELRNISIEEAMELLNEIDSQESMMPQRSNPNEKMEQDNAEEEPIKEEEQEEKVLNG